MAQIELSSLAGMVQQFISRKYSTALIDKSKVAELKSYISQYLYDTGYTVAGYDTKRLVERLYSEMAEYSVLTKYLNDPDVEEVNINGWDDIAVTHLNGHIEKATEYFFGPQHATDVVKKLLQHSGMIIDNAAPLAQGHLPNNTRVTALKDPIVDADRGIAVSIRMLHPQRVDRTNLLRTEALTEDMLGFLETCIRYGVSFVVAGRTSSGKTTLLNALLAGIPDNKRIYTIESGARELSLVKRDENGAVINNVVHTLSRPSDNPSYNISQDDLVMAALRFDPDVICVGEMRNKEAYYAIEASSTDHTVVSTVHGGGGRFAHRRIASLAYGNFERQSLQQAALAFPIVVFAHKLEDNTRKVMDIAECVVDDNGDLNYRKLWRYKIRSNEYNGGKYHIEGEFVHENDISESLKNKLMRGGVPQELLDKYTGKENER